MVKYYSSTIYRYELDRHIRSIILDKKNEYHTPDVFSFLEYIVNQTIIDSYIYKEHKRRNMDRNEQKQRYEINLVLLFFCYRYITLDLIEIYNI